MNIIKRYIIKIYYKYIIRYPAGEYISLGLKVGKNFLMKENVFIDYSHAWHITIGNNVTLSPRVIILAHDASPQMYLGYTRIGKVAIGDQVFIGANSIILPGVTIGSNVIVGSGSVICKDIPDGLIVAGNPARTIGNTKEYVKRIQQEMKISPVFGKEYTISRDITCELKNEMNNLMKNRIGFVE